MLDTGVRLLILIVVLSVTGCGRFVERELQGEIAEPGDFSHLSDRHPCYLEVSNRTIAIRVNCFSIDGDLYIHSSRWAKLPRLGPENWIVTVRREPAVRVEIDDKIYQMEAVAIDDEARRQEILYNRGYWHAWDGITVVRFHPSES